MSNIVCSPSGLVTQFDNADCRNANAGTDPLAVHDIAKLPHTNDAAVLCLLNVRYINNCIYVSPLQPPFRRLLFQVLVITKNSQDASEKPLCHTWLHYQREKQIPDRTVH